jgi:ABC-type lipoprotein release transport system permease subunit
MIAIVAFGSFVIIVFWGMTDGFIDSMIHAQVSLDQGDLKLFAAGYRQDPVPEHGLTSSEISQALTAVDTLRGAHAALRLSSYGMLKSAYGATGMEIRGIDPKREPAVTTLDEHIVEGRFLGGSGEILISRYTAEELDVRLGERVVLLTQSESGPVSRPFTTVGIFSSGLMMLDKSAVLIPIDDARALTGWSGATEVVVSLSHGGAQAAVSALSKRLGEDVLAVTYLDLNPLIRDMIHISVIEMTPMLLLLALLAGFGVANTALYSVLERTREFGVMTAVGMSTRRLARMILTESILVSIIGFLVGGGAGYLLNLYLSHHGWNFGSTFTEMAGNMGMPMVLYSSTSGWYWLGSFSVVVMTGLVAAWYPARRAAKLQPVTAIREG